MARFSAVQRFFLPVSSKDHSVEFRRDLKLNFNWIWAETRVIIMFLVTVCTGVFTRRPKRPLVRSIRNEELWELLPASGAAFRLLDGPSLTGNAESNPHNTV